MYRSLFALIASDEALHTTESRDPLQYPSFGHKDSPYAPPQGMTKVQKDGQLWTRDFYIVWSEFTTEKRFEWFGKWDLERGDDRGMRRFMEKENKRVREEYRKEYIDTVRVSEPGVFLALTDVSSNWCSLSGIVTLESRCTKQRLRRTKPLRAKRELVPPALHLLPIGHNHDPLSFKRRRKEKMRVCEPLRTLRNSIGRRYERKKTVTRRTRTSKAVASVGESRMH